VRSSYAPPEKGEPEGERWVVRVDQTRATSYALSADRLPQLLRYDLRKFRAHGLLERPGRHYAYRLTPKCLKAALLFTLFPQRVCGHLANSY